MKRVRSVLLGLAMAAWLLLPAAAGPAEPGTAATADELLQMHYFPPHDPHAGRLLPAAADLLAAARELPDSIRLGPPPDSGGGSNDDTGAQDSVSAAPPEPVREGWVRVVTRPVVEERKLAYAHFMAGSHDAAAQMYSVLCRQEPNSAHLKAMWALCERRRGDHRRAQELLHEAGRLDDDALRWEHWMNEVGRLTFDKAGEETQ